MSAHVMRDEPVRILEQPRDRLAELGTVSGTALRDAAAVWARSRKCSELKVETQDIDDEVQVLRYRSIA